mmetsp:Transcript_88283/g.222239  ORF Transcript_88283/g.222239 Transcript_88283/m.222239 type:complete len:202 (-) Transcript_88283:157-762(-)
MRRRRVHGLRSRRSPHTNCECHHRRRAERWQPARCLAHAALSPAYAVSRPRMAHARNTPRGSPRRPPLRRTTACPSEPGGAVRRCAAGAHKSRRRWRCKGVPAATQGSIRPRGLACRLRPQSPPVLATSFSACRAGAAARPRPRRPRGRPGTPPMGGQRCQRQPHGRRGAKPQRPRAVLGCGGLHAPIIAPSCRCCCCCRH